MQHGIARQRVINSLCTSLPINNCHHIAHLSQQVIDLQLERKPLLQQLIVQRGIPYQIISVERTVTVASARTHHQTGVQPYFQRQTRMGIQSVGKVQRLHIGNSAFLLIGIPIMNTSPSSLPQLPFTFTGL